MEKCYKCGRAAAFICPDCGSRICRSHMEPRFMAVAIPSSYPSFPGHQKKLRSNYMCPVCWLVRRVTLEERMVKIPAGPEIPEEP